MADVAFQVRLDEETHRRWRVKAAELGYPSLAELVRAAVEAHNGRIVRAPAPGHSSATIIEGPATKVRTISSDGPRDIDPAECPKKVGHRKGVYCKHCGATP